MADGVEIFLGKKLLETVKDRRDLPLIVSLELLDDEKDMLKIVTQRKREVLSVASDTVDFRVAGPNTKLDRKTAVMSGARINVVP